MDGSKETYFQKQWPHDLEEVARFFSYAAIKQEIGPKGLSGDVVG